MSELISWLRFFWDEAGFHHENLQPIFVIMSEYPLLVTGAAEGSGGGAGPSEGPRPHFAASANREKMLMQQKPDTDSPIHRVYLLHTHTHTHTL